MHSLKAVGLRKGGLDKVESDYMQPATRETVSHSACMPRAVACSNIDPQPGAKTFGCLEGRVVGLQDLHLHWYGLEHGLGPPSPLLTIAPLGGMKTGTGGIYAHPWFLAARRP